MPRTILPYAPPSYDRRRSRVNRSRAPLWTFTWLGVAFAAGYLVFLTEGWGSEQLRQVVSGLAFVPMNLAAIALFYRASGRTRLDERVRRALRFFALSSTSILLGSLASFYYSTFRDVDPALTWANVGYFVFYPLEIAGLLSMPMARRVRAEWWKFALDAAMVVVGGGLAAWFLVLFPTAESQGMSLLTVREGAFFVFNLLQLLAIATVLLRRPTGRNNVAFGLLVVSGLLSIFGDMAYTLVYPDVGWRDGAWTDAVYMLSYVLLIASAELYYRRPQGGVRPEALGPTRFQPLTIVPYVSVAFAFGVLLLATLEQWVQPLGPLVVGGIALTALVLARQIVSVRQNVSLLRQAAAAESEARFRALVQHSSDVVMIVETDWTIRFVSPAVRRVFGYEPHDIVRTSILDFVHPDDVRALRDLLRDAAAHDRSLSPISWRVRRPDRSWLDVETIATNLLDEPTVRAIVLNTRDVTERKALEEQLIHQAFHDPLTGLANRALFHDRVSHAVSLAQRQKHSLAVLFLDLDDFKKVNDSLGHAEGDRLLVLAAERLKSCVREADTVARLGGDEFGILSEDPAGDDRGAALAARITAAFNEPFRLGGKELFVTASIGIANDSGRDGTEGLLRNADVAMYSAKSRGKGRHESFRPSMAAALPDRLDLDAQMRQAAERGELVLEYQPIVNLATREIWGAEALVRWNHPTRGRLMPNDFIGLAEEAGVIVPMGRWILREACRQAETWRRGRPGAPPVLVSVNISGRQLQYDGLLDDVRAALAESRLPPTSLVLEITESVLMQHAGVALENLDALKSLGVRLALDDFGTGYSSLSYLQLFPIDVLKIAKPFVDDMARGGADSPIARAIIALGSALRLRTVAEGIETPIQAEGLTHLGCELGQGWHVGMPMDASGIREMALADSRGIPEVWPARLRA